MHGLYRPYHPDQQLLLPPSLRDWLPEGHLALYVSDVVDSLDLSAIYRVYEEAASFPCRSTVMLEAPTMKRLWLVPPSSFA